MSDMDDVQRLAALHRLVDELPKEAFDATFRVLENYMKWAPKGTADVSRMQNDVRERFVRRHEEHARRIGTGYISSTSGGSSFSPDGFGHASTHGWEGHTSVTVQVLFFRGQEMHSTQRLSLSDDRKTLMYSVEASLPGGSPQVHEFKFDLP